MNEIYVKDLLKLCNGKLVIGNEEDIVEDFTNDTRKISNGGTYVGFKGEHNDGNLLYKDALNNGAKVCILEENSVANKIDIENIKEKYNNSNIILVDDTIKAIQKLAIYKRNKYNIPVVGITGSVGKTSTKDIVASVMSKKYKVLKTLGNFNSQIGLPLTILGLKDHNAMVLEMGMNQLGEIRRLTNIAKPTIAVITNIGTAHIGILGTRENILKAKLEIIEGLEKDGVIVINNDNDLLCNWAKEEKNLKIKTYGIENKSDIMPYDIKTSEKGSSFKIKIDNKEYNVSVAVGGNHFVLNSLCAISVGRLLNIDMEDILDGIANFELTKRRMQIEKNKKGIIIINDCYNASYDSMKAAIEYLSKLNANKKIAVLGDMLELGNYSKYFHEKIGEEVAKNKIDILITVGDFAVDIAYKAKEMGINKENIFICHNNIEAIELINKMAKDGDAVLLKASNIMNFQEIFDKII